MKRSEHLLSISNALQSTYSLASFPAWPCRPSKILLGCTEMGKLHHFSLRHLFSAQDVCVARQVQRLKRHMPWHSSC
jgi:hypothetical protein